MPDPLVSCLMVTRNRANLARRAVHCFAQQTWPVKELVVVDDGDEDYEPVLAPYRDRFTIHYHRVAPEPGRYLGGIRNLSLDLASGEYCIQWDDDEWYHPERIGTQMRAIASGCEAAVLKYTLMHLDVPEYVEHPYRTALRRGTPGTILHRRSPVRYPNIRRGEDSEYLRELRKSLKVAQLTEPHGHLFIRCFHGSNTWERRHFTERLHRHPLDGLRYLRARFVDRNLFNHPAFRLTTAEREAAAQFLRDSRELGIIAPTRRA